MSSSRSAWRSSASVCMVRNFRQAKGRWPMPAAHRAEQDRAARGEPHGERDRDQQRAEQRPAGAIAPTMSKVRLSAKSTPSKTGGRELEQRHRLAGHELGAVDQDLHRRRREAHAHAAAVALVDELDGVVLGEVGVGDDHLVDAAARRARARGPSSEPSERRPLAGSGVGERKPTTSIGECGASRERVGDVADVLAACRRAARGAGSRRRAGASPVSRS